MIMPNSPSFPKKGIEDIKNVKAFKIKVDNQDLQLPPQDQQSIYEAIEIFSETLALDVISNKY